MSVIVDVVTGAIKLNNLPDRECFRGWDDFIRRLPEFLSVEIPPSALGVIIGKDSPSEDDRDKIWYRRDASGAFLGIYAFQGGAWKPLYNIPTGQIIWLWGSSQSIPEGFTFIWTGDAVIPSNVVAGIIGQYIPDGSGHYSYFAVRYSGF